MARLLALPGLGLLGAAAAGSAGLREGTDAVTPAQLLAESGGIKWSSCADAAASALFSLEGAHFDARLLQVTARGILAKELTGGNVTMRLMLGKAPADATLWERTKRRLGFALKKRSLTEDFCAQRQRAGLQCSAAPGPQELRFGLASLPAKVLAGEIKMRVEATNQHGRRFLCLQGSLDIRRGVRGGIFRTLAASDSPFGPCAHGSQWEHDTKFNLCQEAKDLWQMNPPKDPAGTCATAGGIYVAGHNWCYLAKSHQCTAAGYNMAQIKCSLAFDDWQNYYKQVADGASCDSVMKDGLAFRHEAEEHAGDCCHDKVSVCSLGTKYAFTMTPPAPAPVAASMAVRAWPVAAGLLYAAAAGALA